MDPDTSRARYLAIDHNAGYHSLPRYECELCRCPACGHWFADAANGCDNYNAHTVHDGTCSDPGCGACFEATRI
jgi:hypothetical protein